MLSSSWLQYSTPVSPPSTVTDGRHIATVCSECLWKNDGVHGKGKNEGRWVSNKTHGTHGSIKCQLLGPEFPQECPQNLDIKEMSAEILEVVGCRDNSVSEVLAVQV